MEYNAVLFVLTRILININIVVLRRNIMLLFFLLNFRSKIETPKTEAEKMIFSQIGKYFFLLKN